MTKTTPSGNRRLGLLLCLAGLLCLFAPSARAADDNTSDAGDPPTRVARISLIDGTVSLQPGGEGDWGAAQRNRPMTVGDKIWSDQNSRAELQTGVVSIHLGSMTALSFLNLDQNIMQVRLPEGSINFRVKEIREGDTFEVDTPNLAFIVKQAGAFRIDVNENGDNTGITVIRGAGQVTANGQTYDIQAGQRGVFNGTDENVQSNIAQAPAPDQLDQWANDRDLREQNSPSARYVPPETPGTEDLDNNGTWSEQPEVNGPVWYPNDVGPDWAPYSNGYWSSIGPWGWTWVGYEPWGFAPYHYGRWGFWGGRWGWCPGPIGYPGVYGPAFVGFLGGGFGFGFGVGFGVGWFPLGWGEPFHPWYHGGFGYVERINVRNTFIRNVNVVHANNFNYSYAHNTRAVTAMSRSGFASGQAVNRGAAHITEASLRGAEVTHNLGVTPSRGSAFGASNLRGNVARPSSTVQNRNVMARTTPGSAAGNAHVQTMNTSRLSAGRFGSASANANAGVNRNNGNANANNSRSWNAQGNTTDRGRAPQGFGSDARPGNNSTYSAGTTRGDRPPWAGSGSANNNARGGGSAYSNNSRSSAPPQRNTPSYNGSRSYSPPPQSRTYSAPSRSYGSAPSNHGGGGGAPAPRGGGGASAPHGGGGGGASHGGGGGGRPHR